ncbi:2-hydroxyacid dehydrogenase [Solimicrobium silvestre]|uniref:Lactate dehydrogenase and related dehydrogenase n=1 Tax=Solimicrobium silvestre TaxID=2099400 RepID=A0A2S9GYX8_9BURK|nr:D-glycerate dehydrogenase [Solimicrobium silvestre]PRC92942.1 Lactate dehydrogenase and related dehydrogenase [Solimicrobium silvestre]
MSKPAVLLTCIAFPEIIEQLSVHFELETNQQDATFTEQELIAQLQNKQAVFTAGNARFTEHVLQHAPQLKLICAMTVGYDNIDVAACAKRGIVVTNAPDVLNQTTADFAWALLLATARRVTESEHWLRAGHWQKWSLDGFLGADVHGKTLGILGMGRIGQAIARRSMGFDMQVLYHNRSRLTPAQEAHSNNASYVSKQELLKSVDHLILMLPYSAATHHCMGAEEFSQMRSSATLINVARGGVVDDAALILALRNQQIAAAGLDVYENEPRLNPEFLGLPNVVLTPHIASATEPTRRAMQQCAVNNLIAYFERGEVINLVASVS